MTLLVEDLASLLSADELNKMLADGLTDLTRRAGELLRPPPIIKDPPRPPTGEEIVLDASNDMADAKSAAARLRELAERLEAEGKDASRVAIRLTAWKRRSE